MRMKAQRKKKTARPAGRSVKPVRRVRAKKTTATTRPATPVHAPRTVTLSSRASLMAAMVVVTGAAILAARGVPSAPETPATDLHLEAAAPPEAFVIVPEADAAERVIAKAPAPEAKTVVANAPHPARRNRDRPAGGRRGSRPRHGHRDADRVGNRDDDINDDRRRLPDVR